jgi:uncharacterized phage-associated protein
VLYFAQAYYLSKVGRPLFSDNIEAWAYGPVVPDVYKKFRSNKSNPIIDDEDKSVISDEDKNTLKKIWGTFGGYSASKLVDITHAHTPWREASKLVNKIISHKAIKEYYAPLLNK